MAAVPIWKDFFVQLAGVYRIIVADTEDVIYSGYAVSKPGETSAQVRINDICADYMERVLFTTPQVMPVTFKVQLRVPGAQGSQWVDLYTVQFLNDWSYDYEYDPTIMGMAFPINGHLDSRMPLVWTGFGESVTATLIMGGSFMGDFNLDFSSDFLIGGSTGGTQAVTIPLIGGGEGMVGTAHLDLEEYPGVIGVEIGGVTYDVVTECAEYALYYINAYGGWDCFLIEGNTLEADSLKRYTREVEYDNRDIRNRGTDNYVNEITKGFTFHTGWLLDDQGKRMHHLINSTFVYLYDIANAQMIPVNIPTTSCEYRTYKNQGNRLVNYTIQVQIAQNRIRR